MALSQVLIEGPEPSGQCTAQDAEPQPGGKTESPEVENRGVQPESNRGIIAQFSPPSLYSTFTTAQKGWIIFIAAWAGWFSTASSFIYFPAIPFLAQDMSVSVQDINLTVTSYMIASGVFPTVTGQFADKYGRRPSLVMTVAVYVIINIGLAEQRSYAALFVLRMFQSAAISGCYSIVYGLISDLTTPAERGGYTGTLSVFLNTPPSIAPIISGLLLIRWTWPIIFWFMAALSATVLLAIVVLVPETSASLSTIFVRTYNVSGLVAGLIYIPFGVGSMGASYLVGQVLNRDYGTTAKEKGLVVDRVRDDDLAQFPIEMARLRTSKYSVPICTLLIAAYGWALQAKASMAVPLVLQFLYGFVNQFLYTSLNTLLVDYHPGRSASAQAANNLVRCELSAAGLAALDAMVNGMGPGWCFVVFAVFHALTLPALLVLERKGVAWRQNGP